MKLDATEVLLQARRIKQAEEIVLMREAAHRVEHAVAGVERTIPSGATAVEVWAAFQEAEEHVLSHGDLLCGDREPTPVQRQLYRRACEQPQHTHRPLQRPRR